MILLITLFVDSKCVELAINLLQLLVHKLKVDTMSAEKLQGMTKMVWLTRMFYMNLSAFTVSSFLN